MFHVSLPACTFHQLLGKVKNHRLKFVPGLGRGIFWCWKIPGGDVRKTIIDGPNILNIKPPFTMFVQKKNSPNSPNQSKPITKSPNFVYKSEIVEWRLKHPCCFCSGFEETNVSLAIVFPNPWQSLQMASIMTHFQHLREFCSEDPSRTGDLLH